MPDSYTAEVQHFRAAQRATRLHILTIITPFSATLDRFVLVEAEAGATLRRCTGCRLSTPIDRGDPEPVVPETLAAFLRSLEAAESAWADDSVPDGAHDGVTLIAERVTAHQYDITHMVSPRSNTPHARLLRAWIDSFPVVARSLR
jgi:predicted short-subunit dehydrogenase-like oxidoreductase (DUF2520 family)